MKFARTEIPKKIYCNLIKLDRSVEKRTGLRLFADCQNVSGIGLLNKKACLFCLLNTKACLFCLLNQSDLKTLVIKQETWYFLLNTQKRAPFLFNKQINFAY